MKIAITGHKHGIGKAFAEQLALKGHEIVGLSRSNGENIRRVEHTANLIDPCDLFINNAQTMFAQTELLYAVWKRWHTLANRKWIWNISTQMIHHPINDTIEGQEDLDMSIYRVQKLTLEEATKQLQFKSGWPKISIIRPGAVETKKLNSTIDKSCAVVQEKSDVNVWVKSVIDTFTQHTNIHIKEISIGHITQRIPL